MARRRGRVTAPRIIRPRRERRITIPQPPYRPLQLHQRDLVRREELQKNPWWFVLHKRGMRQPLVGQDPLEARAVPESRVRGTLPERILYKTLEFPFRLKSGIDFDFQSSADGGRLELGGIVADFMLPFMQFIFQVQGPTHTGHLRKRKDDEQRMILEAMGYTVFYFEIPEIYSAGRLEAKLRKVFGMARSVGTGGVSEQLDEEGPNLEEELINQIWTDVNYMQQLVGMNG